MPQNRALLIGCNYPGTKATLNGCINDVWGTRDMLKQYMGFTDADITILIDTDQKYTQPTGKNIKAKLAEMINAAQDGDVLVMHYSGHGCQVPSDDNDEDDGKDEAMCPTDMNIITDDDLRVIIKPLVSKPGVKFTLIADCCHSGTMLDHEQLVVKEATRGAPPPPEVSDDKIQEILLSGGQQPSKRAIPFADLCDILSEKTGKPVQKGHVREALGSLFGEDASVKFQTYLQLKNLTDMAGNAVAAAGNAVAAAGDALGDAVDDMADALLGKDKDSSSGAKKPAGTRDVQPAGAKARGGGGFSCCGSDAVAAAAPTPKPPAATATVAAAAPVVVASTVKPPAAGSKPPAADQLEPNTGILFAACQPEQTAADACPSGIPTKAFGALSNGLHTTVAQHYAANPDVPITNRNLVIGIIGMLSKGGYAQRPSLECSATNADGAFIVLG